MYFLMFDYCTCLHINLTFKTFFVYYTSIGTLYFHYSCHSPEYKCSAERATLFAIDIPLLFAPHVCCPHLDHPIYLGKSKNVSSAEN